MMRRAADLAADRRLVNVDKELPSSRTCVGGRSLWRCGAAGTSLLILSSGAMAFPAATTSPDCANPAAIIRHAVEANTRDWQAQLQYSYNERDIKSKVDDNGKIQSRQSKTYRVLMIGGSPYQRLLEVNGEPIPRAQRQTEETKLQMEISRRSKESPSQRHSRISQYQSSRAEEHLLMEQMAVAFYFRLLGEEEIEGTPCFRLEAQPKSDYNPPVEKARVLQGMRGQMWIDKLHFHWVKVQAQVTQAVTFGFFIARVKPGTQFELDQMPVGDFWLPRHFIEKVNASVFGLYGYRSQEESLYSDYKRNPARNGEMAALN